MQREYKRTGSLFGSLHLGMKTTFLSGWRAYFCSLHDLKTADVCFHYKLWNPHLLILSLVYPPSHFFIPIIKSHSCLRSSQIVGWFRWQRGEVCFSLHHHLHMSKKKGPSGGHPACDNIRLHWAVSFGQRGCEPSKIALTDLLCLASVFPELQLLNKLSLGTQGKESSTFYL